MKYHSRRLSPHPTGFMLLEALVAILIFSLGILGVMTFQMRASQYTAESRYRTEASLYADELVAKMMVSNKSTLSAQYSTGGAAFNSWLTNRVQKSGSGLPNGNATCALTQDATTGAFTAVIEVSWTPPDLTAASNPDAQFDKYTTSALIDP